MKKALLALTLLVNTPAFAESTVNLIGLDEAGKELNIPMKSSKWQKRISKVFTRVTGDVLPEIKSYTSNEKFEFSQFDLGLSVKMKFGVGVLEESPVKLAMSVEPQFVLYFKK